MGKRPIDQALDKIHEMREGEPNASVRSAYDKIIEMVKEIAEESHAEVTKCLERAIQERQEELEERRRRVSEAETVEEVVDVL